MKHGLISSFALLALCLALVACGGGSSGTLGVGTLVVTGVTGPISAAGGPFVVEGGDFSSMVGARVRVFLEAAGGITPFAEGTSATAEVEGVITSPTTVEAVGPAAVVCGVPHVDVYVAVVLPSGVWGRSATPVGVIYAPKLENLSGGGTFESAVPSTLTLTGTDLAPVGGTVLVRWAASTPIFLAGTSTQVQTSGVVTSSTNITAVSPEARVCGTTSIAAVIDNVAFPGGSCTDPSLSLAVTFLAPTIATIANVQAGSPWDGSSSFAAAVPETFRLVGTGFGPVGGSAQVSWHTPGHDSFGGGTSDTVVVSGMIVSATEIVGASPDAVVCDVTGLYQVDIGVTLPGGSCAPSSAALAELRAPTVASIEDVVTTFPDFQAAIVSTFRIQGGDFGPPGGTAHVTFTSTSPAPADQPFLGGTSAAVTVTATVLDRSTIEGTSPEAVLVPALDGGAGTACVSLTANVNVGVRLAQGSCTTPPGAAARMVGPSLTDAGGPAPFDVPSTVLLGAATAESFTISGAGFAPTGGSAQVTFSDPTGGTPFDGAASVTVTGLVLNPTTIQGTLPTITAPRLTSDVGARVLVAITNGSSAYCNNAVDFVAPPTVTGLTNNRAPFQAAAPGSSIANTWLACIATSTTITGTGFHANVVELFHDQAIGVTKPIGTGALTADPGPAGTARVVTPPTTVTGWSPTDATITSPTPVDLRVVNPDQQYHVYSGLTWETTGTLPNVNASRQLGTNAEMAMCVNPTNPLNAAICAHDWVSNLRSMFFSFTKDGGRTWTTRKIGPPGSAADDGHGANGFRFDPMITCDSFGNIYAIYGVDDGTGRYVIAAQSADGGATFPNVFTFAFPASSGLDRWTAAAGKDGAIPGNQAIYVGLVDFGTYDIRVAGVTVSGLGIMPVSMGSSVVPNDAAPATGRFLQHGSPSVGPNGELVVTWVDGYWYGSSSPRTRIYCDVDRDGLGGSTYALGTDLFVADSIMPALRQPGVRPLPQRDRGYPLIPMPVVVQTGTFAGRIVVTWTGVNESTWPGTDDMEVLTAYSDNLGVSWSAPALVHSPSTSHQFHPWLASDPVSGQVLVTWYDTRNTADNQTTQRFAAASLNGAAWGPSLLLSQGKSNCVGSGGNDYLEYNGIAAYGRCLYACWADNSNYTGNNPNGTQNGDGLDVMTAAFMAKP